MNRKSHLVFLILLISLDTAFAQKVNWRGTSFLFTQPSTSYVSFNIKICSENDNIGSIQFNDTIIYFENNANNCASITLEHHFFDSLLTIGKNNKQAINIICSTESTCNITTYNTAENEGYTILPTTALDSQYYDYDFDKIIVDSTLRKTIIANDNNTILHFYENDVLIKQDTLQKDDVLLFKGKTLNIKGNKPFAYFSSAKSSISGSACRNICCSEELYEQVVPYYYLGTNYLVNSINNNTEFIIVINSFEDNNCVEINNSQIILQKNEHYYFFSEDPCIIRSSKNISVHRFFESKSCTNNSLGDPEMFLVHPIEYLQQSSIFYPVNGYFQFRYLNIIVPNESLDSIYLNGINIKSKFKPFTYFYSIADFEIDDKLYKLESNNGFQAFTYGISNDFFGPNSAGYLLTGKALEKEYKFKSTESYSNIILCDNNVFHYHSTDTNTSYIWNDGSISNHKIISDSGTYFIEIQNTCLNYSYRDTIIINKKDCLCEPKIPGIFSPNHDGINEELNIEYNCSLNNEIDFEIYNRWGNLIYKDNSNKKKWDGINLNKQESESGIYVYVVSYTDLNNRRQSKSGVFYLIR